MRSALAAVIGGAQWHVAIPGFLHLLLPRFPLVARNLRLTRNEPDAGQDGREDPSVLVRLKRRSKPDPSQIILFLSPYSSRLLCDWPYDPYKDRKANPDQGRRSLPGTCADVKILISASETGKLAGPTRSADLGFASGVSLLLQVCGSYCMTTISRLGIYFHVRHLQLHRALRDEKQKPSLQDSLATLATLLFLSSYATISCPHAMLMLHTKLHARSI
jgi:hypothetical protein